jgi:hypothetical protein
VCLSAGVHVCVRVYSYVCIGDCLSRPVTHALTYFIDPLHSLPLCRSLLLYAAAVDGGLSELAAMAAAAEEANELASAFVRLRNYVYRKKLFRRNGLTVRLGTMDIQLSLYADLPSSPLLHRHGHNASMYVFCLFVCE